jgi:hypothetical protein
VEVECVIALALAATLIGVASLMAGEKETPIVEACDYEIAP